MILYHGSNLEIELVDFNESKPGKDFGIGFYQFHSYDIIYGPIANDNIGLQMRRIDAGMIDWNQFVKELEFKGGETYQYLFGTEKSLKYLKKL